MISKFYSVLYCTENWKKASIMKSAAYTVTVPNRYSMFVLLILQFVLPLVTLKIRFQLVSILCYVIAIPESN